MTRRKLIVGNWKMHGTSADLAEIEAIAAAAERLPTVDVAVCVPAVLIDRAVRAAPGFAIGAQDVHQAERGAFTGCVSTEMLTDAGASLTILGHSERRDGQHEDDAQVRAKAEAALRAGLSVIVCVGESDTVRESGEAVETVSDQLGASLPGDVTDFQRLAVAYEPIWAIGTGKVASPADIAAMHSAIRTRLRAAYGAGADQVRILYGGSVKGANAAEIFTVPDVDGALVGGASLKAADLLPIVDAAARAVEAPPAMA